MLTGSDPYRGFLENGCHSTRSTRPVRFWGPSGGWHEHCSGVKSSPSPNSKRVLIAALALVTVLGWTGIPKAAAVSIEVEIADRNTADGQCSFLVIVDSPSVLSDSEVRSNLKLEMPGFGDVHLVAADGRNKLRVTARLSRAGFYPFRVSWRWHGEDYTVTDYFVFEETSGESAFNHLGYYVFLGRGDFWDETHQLALWTLADWMAFSDWMAAHRADTLYVLLNGYTLAYPSEKYRMLRDPFSNNARYGFLKQFIDYAHRRGIRVYLVLTTDDHAEGFGNLYPELTRVDKFGYASSRSALALEEPKVKQYIGDVLHEALMLYGNADGFVFHPSEADPDRFNQATRASYLHDTGRKLTTASKVERYRWYNQKFAELLASLYEEASRQNPKLEFIMFNCWWQDEYASLYQKLLPRQFKICVWFYDEKEEKTFRKWPIWPWVEAFGPDRVIYMPSGEAYLYPEEPGMQMERHIRVDRLVSAAEALSVKSCVFFAGWNLGSDVDRRRDLAIARSPTASLVTDRSRALELLPELYTNYFGARSAIFK